MNTDQEREILDCLDVLSRRAESIFRNIVAMIRALARTYQTK